MDFENKLISGDEFEDLKKSKEGEICALVPALGAICPRCMLSRLDYNSLLNLQCPVCGFETASGGCT